MIELESTPLDRESKIIRAQIKRSFVKLEVLISQLEPGTALNLAVESLHESFGFVEKAILNDQVHRLTPTLDLDEKKDI